MDREIEQLEKDLVASESVKAERMCQMTYYARNISVHLKSVATL